VGEVVIRAPRIGDPAALAPRLRAQDVAELNASGHVDLQHVLQFSLHISRMKAAAEIDGELVALFGVSSLSLLGGMGAPWFLGSDAVVRHARVLQRMAPGYISEMLQAYPHLINRVHAENTISVRWLKRLGFTVHPARLNAHGHLFHDFEMKRDV